MIFRSKNSLILCYDHLEDDSTREMLEQIDEVRQYYEAAPLSTVVSNLEKGRVKGTFSVLFKNPRKSVFLRAVPRLLDREIPMAFALRADCIGTNRLPQEEELELYAEGYRDHSEEFRRQKEKIWTDPDSVDSFLFDARKRFGPLPVDKANPTTYFVTWGKILEIPKRHREIALGIWFSPAQKQKFESEKSFIETQIGEKMQVGLANKVDSSLQKSELKAIVTPSVGAVDKTTSLFDLPQWSFAKS